MEQSRAVRGEMRDEAIPETLGEWLLDARRRGEGDGGSPAYDVLASVRRDAHVVGLVVLLAAEIGGEVESRTAGIQSRDEGIPAAVLRRVVGAGRHRKGTGGCAPDDDCGAIRFDSQAEGLLVV